jgi:hypothetical protein
LTLRWVFNLILYRDKESLSVNALLPAFFIAPLQRINKI